ncbi:MAG: hypothetical protein ACI9VM_000854 [Candidatus Azotimanducaceae bacterium]|jgi:hypothetical protein
MKTGKLITYDLYGIQSSSLDQARKILETTLELNFKAHESSYHGGDYYRIDHASKELFILQKNFDEFTKEWNQQEHCDYPYLLFVTEETTRAEKVAGQLNPIDNIVLLSHKEL